ncbi:MAG: polysaccharide deacetylase family protein [Bacilli bacterium]|nr:polysaccharide deacetylase family protein [Bacilli bacterium]MDD4282262.1 polysaccharide deacetylase family protein [Bacilli bacterium]MDD4718408.1 polysaccharide deacetylase family protein [Bacilli bacterium]
MKKFFQRLGMITLICLSFIYTERAANVLIEVDDIMVKIKEEKHLYELEPVDAIITDKTIIPGIDGYEVNELTSYHKLKKIGHYNNELLEYKVLKPNTSLTNHYDRYIISGNQNKKSVSLLFKVQKDDNINKILNILNQKQVKANFFVDSIWVENNNNLLLSLIKEGHIIGNMSYELNYNHSDFIWMDTIIKKVGNQKQSYCYNEVDDEMTLKICSINKNYTIRPNIIIKKYPALEVKEQLQNGAIISFPINGIVEEELNHIIDNIYSKGLKVEILTKLLSE